MLTCCCCCLFCLCRSGESPPLASCSHPSPDVELSAEQLQAGSAAVQQAVKDVARVEVTAYTDPVELSWLGETSCSQEQAAADGAAVAPAGATTDVLQLVRCSSCNRPVLQQRFEVHVQHCKERLKHAAALALRQQQAQQHQQHAGSRPSTPPTASHSRSVLQRQQQPSSAKKAKAALALRQVSHLNPHRRHLVAPGPAMRSSSSGTAAAAGLGRDPYRIPHSAAAGGPRSLHSPLGGVGSSPAVRPEAVAAACGDGLMLPPPAFSSPAAAGTRLADWDTHPGRVDAFIKRKRSATPPR